MDREPTSAGILQVVSGDGTFNTEGVDKFVKDTGVESSGVGYTVVAIMGPQSSGKSTLLNHLVRGASEGPPRGAGAAAAADRQRQRWAHCCCLSIPAAPRPIHHMHCGQSVSQLPPTCLPSLAPASRRWTR